MTSEQKKQQVQDFLIKELGGANSVKEFAGMYRELGLADLGNIKHIDSVTNNGGELLMTLVSYYSLGFTHKLIEIKNKIQGK